MILRAPRANQPLFASPRHCSEPTGSTVYTLRKVSTLRRSGTFYFALTAKGQQNKCPPVRFLAQDTGLDPVGISAGNLEVLYAVRECVSTQFPKRRARLQTLGKTLLVSRQAGTHQMMHRRVAEEMHLFHCLVRSPALCAHAIRCDHHSGSVIAPPAVHENLLVRMFPN